MGCWNWWKKTAAARRVVRIGEHNPKTGINRISTTKYTLLTFLPLFVLEQLRNVVNVFFIFISAIQVCPFRNSVPRFSHLSDQHELLEIVSYAVVQMLPSITSIGKHSTITPLCVILLVTAAKEIFEDIVSLLERPSQGLESLHNGLLDKITAASHAIFVHLATSSHRSQD